MTDSRSSWKKRLAIASVVFGMLLMLYMIVYEDDPGGIPLIMIVLGCGYLFWRAKRERESV